MPDLQEKQAAVSVMFLLSEAKRKALSLIAFPVPNTFLPGDSRPSVSTP